MYIGLERCTVELCIGDCNSGHCRNLPSHFLSKYSINGRARLAKRQTYRLVEAGGLVRKHVVEGGCQSSRCEWR